MDGAFRPLIEASRAAHYYYPTTLTYVGGTSARWAVATIQIYLSRYKLTYVFCMDERRKKKKRDRGALLLSLSGSLFFSAEGPNWRGQNWRGTDLSLTRLNQSPFIWSWGRGLLPK